MYEYGKNLGEGYFTVTHERNLNVRLSCTDQGLRTFGVEANAL